MRAAVFACLLAAASLAAAAVNPFIHVDASTFPGQFVDGSNRGRIFHGVAAIYKTPPYYPILDHFDAAMSLTEGDMDNLASWGFTAVRLFAAWPGVNPTRGSVNMTYLGVLETIVNQLGARGIYTILDAHQDVWHPRFCGEGAPDWAVVPFLNETESFPEPLSAPYNITNGSPSRKDCLRTGFALYYPTFEASNAFQDFYDNTHGLRDAFNAFWLAVATYFQSNPYVLSYELLNEPWSGNVWKDPLLFLPTIADKQNLVPLYEGLHNTIRTVDTQHTILFEPTTFGTSLPFGNLSVSGFTQGPGGPLYNDRQAFSYHVYCDTNSTGQPSIPAICALYEDEVFAQRLQDLRTMGVAGFMTEFGAYSTGYGNDLTDSIHVLGVADTYLQSWAYWQFKGYGDPTTSDVDAEGNVLEGFFNEATGALYTDKVKMLARPYALAVGGRYNAMVFDVPTTTLSVSYSVLTSAVSSEGINTEIFTGEAFYYGGGYSVSVTPQDLATTKADPANSRLYVVHTPAAKDGDVITITLSPK